MKINLKRLRNWRLLMEMEKELKGVRTAARVNALRDTKEQFKMRYEGEIRKSISNNNEFDMEQFELWLNRNRKKYEDYFNSRFDFWLNFGKGVLLEVAKGFKKSVSNLDKTIKKTNRRFKKR